MFACSWPLATLTLLSTGVELGPTWRGLRLFVPVWRARFDELAVVEIIETQFRWAKGLRLIPTSGSSVAFGVPPRLELDDIVTALRSHGVRVEVSAERLRLFGPP
jgi:hypothetical protein